MTIIKSLACAFLMYSRIPMPQVEWKEENRRYSLAMFPFVGAVIGGLIILWTYLCGILHAGRWLYAAVCCVIPIAVTGGIHADGFCDVTDARSSYAPRDKKLEIMSDPHVGSFAVFYSILYFLLQFGLFTEVGGIRAAVIPACGYVLSRALSGFAAVTFRCAKKDGTLQSFVKPAHRRNSIIILAVEACAAAAGMILAAPVCGAAAITAAGLALLYYRISSYRVFGGITGDTAGHFLQVCELAELAAAVLAGLIQEVL